MKNHISSLIFIFIFFNCANAQLCDGPLSVTVVGTTSSLPITIDEESSRVFCTDSNEGSINITVYGGTPEYEYRWAHIDSSLNFLDDLPVGSYFVTVTDKNGCSEERTITILHVDPLIDSLDLIDYDACGYCYLHDGTQSFFYFEEEYIGSVVDLKTNRDLGSTIMCTEISAVTYRCLGDPVLRRKWEVDTDSLEKANIRLFFSEEELHDLAKASGYENVIQLVNSGSLYVKKFNLGSDNCDLDFPILLNTEDFSITLFDEFKKVWSIEITDCDDASILVLSRGISLPVDFLSFTGKALENVNRLFWTTANEVGNDGFFVEKSRNGLQFESLGYVSGKNLIESDYTFDDNNPWTGSNFYKLKQVDLDGGFKYSHIIHLVREADFDFRVVENPFLQTLYVIIETSLDIDASIRIFAMNGKVVYDREYKIDAGNSELQIDLDALLSGNYILRLFNKGDNTFLTKKIVKI